MVMGQSDVVGMRNPALYCRIFLFVHCHGLLFGYKFLHYIAGFFVLFTVIVCSLDMNFCIILQEFLMCALSWFVVRI